MANEKKPSGLLPFVRHMVLCEHAESQPDNPRRVNIYGVLTRAVALGDPSQFPRHFGFSVYMTLTECRHGGASRIVVSHADSHEVCYASQPQIMSFGIDPLAIHDIVIRVPSCKIPRPGVYLVEFEFDGVVLAQESFALVTR
jgi:hypothetical protein